MEKMDKCPYIGNCLYYKYNPERMEETKCTTQKHIECHYYIYRKQVEICMERIFDA